MSPYTLDASFYEHAQKSDTSKRIANLHFEYALSEAKRKEAWLKTRIVEYGLTEKEAIKYGRLDERRDSYCRIISCNFTITWTPWLRFKVWLRKKVAK